MVNQRASTPPGIAGAIERGGVLVVDKPAGPTSHDVVTVVRRALGHVKVGHTGTLDPAATGVLPIVIGRATRLAQYLSSTEKEYDAEIRLGSSTDTYDATGHVTFQSPEPATGLSRDAIETALLACRGRFPQDPPAYSAKQAGGVRAYDEARRGRTPELAPVEVELRSVEILSFNWPDFAVRLVTSSGFYVRSFAHDMGRQLGTGGHLRSLRRLRSGPFGLDAAITLDTVVNERVSLASRMIGIDLLLPELPPVRLSEEGCAWIAHGRPLHRRVLIDGLAAHGPDLVRLLSPDGKLLGLGRRGADGTLHPALVLV